MLRIVVRAPIVEVADQTWRVTLRLRIVAMTLWAAGVALAIVITVSGGVASSVPVLAWCGVAGAGVIVWRGYFAPRITCTSEAVEVTNRFSRARILYGELELIDKAYDGLLIITRDGRMITACAVRQPIDTRFTHVHTRDDDVVAAIMARTSTDTDATMIGAHAAPGSGPSLGAGPSATERSRLFWALASKAYPPLFGAAAIDLVSTVPGLASPTVSVLRGLAFVPLAWSFVVIVATIVAFVRYVRAYRHERSTKPRTP